MLNLDLTKIETKNDFGLLPEGDYQVTCVAAEVKDTKAGTGQYISARFKIESKEFMNRQVFHNFNIKNPNEKAQEIGLSQIKAFLLAGNRDAASLKDVSALCGVSCTAHVTVQKSDQFGDSNVIKYFKKTDANSLSQETDLPF